MRNRKFLYSAFYGYTPEDVTGLLEANGCPTKEERGQRRFPVSDHASDVTRALELAMKHAGVRVHLKTRVTGSYLNITPDIGGFQYYAISACDRFGNESPATQEYLMEMKRSLKQVWNPRSRITADGVKVDDRRLSPTTLPPPPSSLKKKGRK